jgi:hypothetical protein
MPMPRKPGYGTEWKIVKDPRGNRTVYTRHCDFCGNYYEGCGARFCGQSCAMKWVRANNKEGNYHTFSSGADNPKGGKWTAAKREKNSVDMKARWASGAMTGKVFTKTETSLEKTARLALEKLGISFKQKYWVNKKGRNPKEYDFYVPEFNLLLEIDGTYWHSLPENILNDAYKDELALFAGYFLQRISEPVTEDAIRAAIADWKKKQSINQGGTPPASK